MRLALIIIAAAALSACGADTGETAAERRSAAGEVLGGEITDDMLPLDTVRSTSPAGRSGPDEEAGPESSATREPGAAQPPPATETSGEPEPSATDAPAGEPAAEATPE